MRIRMPLRIAIAGFVVAAAPCENATGLAPPCEQYGIGSGEEAT